MKRNDYIKLAVDVIIILLATIIGSFSVFEFLNELDTISDLRICGFVYMVAFIATASTLLIFVINEKLDKEVV